MTRMRYVKMDRIMNHMLIHALREVFRQEKEQGLPVDTTRDLVLKLAEQEEGKLYLTEAEHSKSVEALNQLRDTYLKNGRYSDGIDSVLLKIMKSRYNEQSVNCGRRVTVLEPKGNWDGIALGINEAGELLVENEAGEICTVYAGEVSVRGIYGYAY